jgi:hypothetical protein
VRSAIVSFYLGTAPDAGGRIIGDVLAWDQARLESVHDYIQWLFPLPEASRFNPAAPRLLAVDIAAFHADPQLRAALIQSLEKMLRFYGLICDYEQGTPEVRRGAAFAASSPQWLERGNHNHLRISRILRSLTVLGCERHARAFYRCLESLYRDDSDSIGADTFGHWTRAVNDTPAAKERSSS